VTDLPPPAYRPPVQPPPGWEGRTPKHFPPSDKATIPGAMGVKLAGVSFAPSYPRNLRALAALAGDGAPRIVLLHNPANTHDTNAVEVRAVRHTGETVMLGHLPAALAARIAPELDAGEPWEVTHYEVLEHPSYRDRPGISIDLRRG
jgi:hypothetical protein